MIKYINILLLAFFVVGATVDIAVIDAVEFQHELIGDDTQTLPINLDHEQNTKKDQHCADHCLHHLAPISIMDIKHIVNLHDKGIPFGKYTLYSQLSKPSTPPPLYQLS